MRALGGGYSNVDLTFVYWWRRSFLIGKILINARTLQDSFLVGIPLIRVDCGIQEISLHSYPWGQVKPGWTPQPL